MIVQFFIAYHFYNENIRVDKAVDALESNDFEAFKEIIVDSGKSSYMLNQNVYSPANPTEQKLSLALCISEEMLKSKGAYKCSRRRLCGVLFRHLFPMNCFDEYKAAMESVFGIGNCHVLIIRPVGGTKVM